MLIEILIYSKNGFKLIYTIWNMKQNIKQAGAELCQAQVKLGLAKLDLWELRPSFIFKETEVVLIQKVTEVVFYLQKN